jgi:oxepin-CoA hydrolase/3-oxo-5,6-dehydrosuberyl-CoA semialdehyde dehydrogenase
MHTPSTLQSYIAGRWHGQSAHQPLHSALDNQLIFHTHAEKSTSPKPSPTPAS